MPMNNAHVRESNTKLYKMARPLFRIFHQGLKDIRYTIDFEYTAWYDIYTGGTVNEY